MKIIIIILTIILNYSNLISNEIWTKVLSLNNISEVSIRTKCNDSLNCIHLTRYSGYSRIFLSNDGGINWFNIIDNYLTKDLNQFHDVSFPAKNNIFVLSEGNFILKFDNQGRLLKKISLGVKNPSNSSQIRDWDLEMLDTLKGIACIRNLLFYTDDGWRNFRTIIPDSVDSTHIKDIYIQDSIHFCYIDSKNIFGFTSDMGNNFEKVKIDYAIGDIFFLNRDVGFLKGSKRLNPQQLPSEWSEVVLKTTNSGRNWFTVLDTIFDVYNTGGDQIFMLNELEGGFISKEAVFVETNDCFNSFLRSNMPDKGDKPGATDWTCLTYSGNRPIVGISNWGIFTRIDTVYMNLIPPNLISPPDKSEKLNIQQNFQFSVNESANKYIFQIAKDENFESIFRSDTLASGQLQGTMSHFINLPDNCTDYYWRVASYKSNTAKWSSTFTFRTKLEQASLKTPFNQAKEISTDTIFYWNKLNNAERYHLQIAINNGDNKTFDDLIFSQDTLTKTEYRMPNLPEGIDLIWHVRGYCFDGYGDWSPIWRLRTKLNTSVKENTNKNNILLNPNPASDYITIQTSEVLETSEVSKVQIFNTLGIEVISTPSAALPPLNEGNLRIDISNLPTGVYFVKIIGSNGACSIVEKFVKM